MPAFRRSRQAPRHIAPASARVPGAMCGQAAGRLRRVTSVYAEVLYRLGYLTIGSTVSQVRWQEITLSGCRGSFESRIIRPSGRRM